MATRNASLAKRVAAACAAGAVLLGWLAVVGWMFGLPLLTQVSPAYRAIAPSATAALVLLGAVLLALSLGRLGRGARASLGVVAGLVSIYGLLDLVGFFAGADLNREEVLTAFFAKAWSIPFQPMSPGAAALMLLVGAALVALLLRPCEEAEPSHAGSAAGVLGAVASGGALVFVLSYVHGMPLLYGSNALPIAATCAAGFLLLGIGVMAAAGPACWPLRPVSGDSVRARMLRTAVPLTVLAVLVSIVAHERVPQFASLNRALQSSFLAVVFAVIAGLVASRVAAVVGHALDVAQAAQREAQEALRQSEQRWATTLGSIGDAVIATDIAGRVTFMNRVAERLTGWALAEAAVRPVTEVFHITNEVTREEVESPVAKVLREGVVVGLANHTVLVTKDGVEIPIDDSGAPIIGEDGGTRGVVLVFHDVTARRQAEQALRESEGRYRSLFENMLDGYAYCRMLYEDGRPSDFVYLDVNSAFGRLTGLKDVAGKRVSEVIPGIRETNPELLEIYGRVARSGQPERFETYLDSLGMWLAISVYSPQADHFVAVFDNITARRRAEEALRESEERLRFVLETCRIGAWDMDIRDHTTIRSPEHDRIYGYDAMLPEWTYEMFLEHVVPEDRAWVDATYQEAARTQRRWSFEFRIRRPDGQIRWVWATGDHRREADGTVRRVAGIVQDVTARKRAEEGLRESEELLRTLVDGIPDPVYIKDRESRIVMANPALAEVAGRSLEEILGRTDSEYYGDAQAGRALREHDLSVMASGKNLVVEETVPTPRGPRTFLSTKAARRDAQGRIVGVIGVSRDITERKLAEEARERLHAEMERQRELLETVVENSRHQLVYLDREFNFIWVNEAYARACQRPRESFPGHNHFEFYPNEENEAIFRRVRETGQPVEFLAKPFVFPDHPEWGTTYWDWRLAPLKARTGEVEGFVFSLADVTESIRARERLLEAERARAAIAEHLSDEIAHRVKNNLAMVSGLLQMQMLSEPNPEAADAVRDAIGRIRTFVTLHEQMYASHTEEADLLVALQQVATTITELFAGRDNVAISVRGEPFRCGARVATNLSVIANELVTNALKHGGPGADGRRTVVVSLHRAGEDAMLTVWNSGAPVPGDLDPKTSRTMGLRLVHDIVVAQYRGRFSVRPSEGGTLAEIIVPGEAIRADSLPR